jgi:hypothetical protein
VKLEFLVEFPVGSEIRPEILVLNRAWNWKQTEPAQKLASGQTELKTGRKYPHKKCDNFHIRTPILANLGFSKS